MPARDQNGRLAWLAGFVLAALILIAGVGPAVIHLDFAEPDNAMRLVRVRDMLAGQGWFDNVQHRLNPPDGTAMHWAQWIDALLAAAIGSLAPFFGQTTAEVAVAFIWPLSLLAVFMMLVVQASGQIGAVDGLRGEAQWAGSFIAALAFPTIEKFSPGSFDHHNVNLLLAFAAIVCLMRIEHSPRHAAGAGLSLSLALATAAEAMPLVLAGLSLVGSLWLVQPARYRKGLAWLGCGLITGSVMTFLALAPPWSWTEPVCDAMGAPFLGVGLAGGGIALALARAPELLAATLTRRLGLACGLGSVAVVSLVLLFPQCAGGGYAALGAEMRDLWMSQISETRSIGALLREDPSMILVVAGAPFVGLLAALMFLRVRWRALQGWVVLAFLLSGWAVLIWQIRGSPFATAFAVPFCAWAVAKARGDYRRKASLLRSVSLAGVVAGSAAGAWASAGEVLQTHLTPPHVMAGYQVRISSARQCSEPEAYRSLAAVRRGVILNQFELGPNVLLWTGHSVLAGPYHRDVSGTTTMMNAMRERPDAARGIVLASAADYVLVCPAAPETAFYAMHAAGGAPPEATLSAKLGRDDPPYWLERVSLRDSPLKLYRIRR